MRTLDLDFGRRRRLLPVLRWVLAGCAAAACVASIGRYLDYRAAAARWELAQAQLGDAQQPDEPIAGPADELAAQLRQANAAYASLAAAWSPLFDSLETVPAGDIALLNLGADAAAGTVTIEAEARSTAAMQAYLDALGTSGYLGRVHLVSQQSNSQAGKSGLRFSVLASWPALGNRSAGAGP